jgi:uncharacterized protein (TIGR03083 family)
VNTLGDVRRSLKPIRVRVPGTLTAVDTMRMARDERTELAEFLATLAPGQWEAATLCDRWRVREVVAHVYSYEDLGFARLAARMLKAGMNPDRANALGVTEHAADSDEQLLARAREHIQPTGLTAMMGGRIALTDTMIHHQDIRRPLGLPRSIPADRLTTALETARKAPTIGAAKRIRGLTLTSTSSDWSTGTGPLVEGPGEALLMAIAGRRAALAELSGPGVMTLAQRIGT